ISGSLEPAALITSPSFRLTLAKLTNPLEAGVGLPVETGAGVVAVVEVGVGVACGELVETGVGVGVAVDVVLPPPPPPPPPPVPLISAQVDDPGVITTIL